MEEKKQGLPNESLDEPWTNQSDVDQVVRRLYYKLGFWNESESKISKAIDQIIVKDPG